MSALCEHHYRLVMDKFKKLIDFKKMSARDIPDERFVDEPADENHEIFEGSFDDV